MSSSSPQRIELCGVTVDVETDHADLARYLRGHFGHVQAPDATSATADVSVRVRWTEGPRETARPETVFPDWPVDTMIDRHVYVGPNRVVWLRVDDVPALALASEHGGPTRRFDLRFHFSLGSQGWRERLKRAVYRQKVSALRRSRLSTLTYYAVYYPVWWHLESRAAGHPLHAAGVAMDGRALVLAGLPGAGKSTLAASLLTVPGAELLADNVVLHDGRQIYGCFEPVLLDEQTRAWLPQPPPLRALGRRHVFKRDAYHAPHRTDQRGRQGGASVSCARRDPRYGRAGCSGRGARASRSARAAARGDPLLRARGARRGTCGGGRRPARRDDAGTADREMTAATACT